MTSWGAILPGQGTAAAHAQALDALALRYSRPIQAWLRRALARSDDEAAELRQDFFLWVIESGFLGKADPARGRFRAFLKTALRRYVADSDRMGRAQKRGGRRRKNTIDQGDDAPSMEIADADARTPDEILDEAWRAEVVKTALERLEGELSREGRETVFAVFKAYFLDPSDATDYKTVAARHGITTVDVSNFLSRAKERYRSALRATVVDTVQSPDDLEAELQWLLTHTGR
jgi:RNA polymerase sigma-70 factor (ECF subfamily)